MTCIEISSGIIPPPGTYFNALWKDFFGSGTVKSIWTRHWVTVSDSKEVIRAQNAWSKQISFLETLELFLFLQR